MYVISLERDEEETGEEPEDAEQFSQAEDEEPVFD